MEAKSSSRIGAFFYPMFAISARAKTSLARSERELFSPNCSSFAVECVWESNNHQNVRNLGFRKKPSNFSKSPNVANFF